MSNKLMLGLWRYVIDVPPVLWKKQIDKGKRKFEKEHGGLSAEYRLIHHFIVRRLPMEGRPLAPELISRELGLSVDLVRGALEYLEKRLTFLYRNRKGEVAWAYPVTVDKTPHRVIFNTGEALYAA